MNGEELDPILTGNDPADLDAEEMVDEMADTEMADPSETTLPEVPPPAKVRKPRAKRTTNESLTAKVQRDEKKFMPKPRAAKRKAAAGTPRPKSASSKKVPPMKKAVARKATPKGDRPPCLCGCGGVPSGRKSRFLPGHDARFYASQGKNGHGSKGKK